MPGQSLASEKDHIQGQTTFSHVSGEAFKNSYIHGTLSLKKSNSEQYNRIRS